MKEDLIVQKYEEIQANSPIRQIQRITKERVKKLKSPDLKRCYSLHCPSLRATFYIRTKKRLDDKIKLLQSCGFGYIIKEPEK